MNKFKPDMYVKDILSINYDKLKKSGIKVLLYDFDNTIIAHKVYEVDKKYVDLINKLKKDFDIYIISNSFNYKKLAKISSILGIKYVARSLKPLKHGFKKLKFDLDIDNKSICMIGDQILTDVYGSKRMGFYSILIDPITRDNEIIFTRFNRRIEESILKKYIKRGDFYE